MWAGWQALKRETDPMSKQRRAKLEEEVAGKKEEERRLTQEWQVRRQGADEGRKGVMGLQTRIHTGAALALRADR